MSEDKKAVLIVLEDRTEELNELDKAGRRERLIAWYKAHLEEFAKDFPLTPKWRDEDIAWRLLGGKPK